MVKTELVTINNILDNFAPAVEHLRGYNPLRVAQKNKRHKSDLAHILSYIKAYGDDTCDTSDVANLLGFLHINMISAASDFDMSEIIGYNHGLVCMQVPTQHRGFTSCMFGGNGEQWKIALNLANTGPDILNEWSQSCLSQLATHDLKDLFGIIPTHKRLR